jgi:hypothetical protein
MANATEGIFAVIISVFRSHTPNRGKHIPDGRIPATRNCPYGLIWQVILQAADTKHAGPNRRGATESRSICAESSVFRVWPQGFAVEEAIPVKSSAESRRLPQ